MYFNSYNVITCTATYVPSMQELLSGSTDASSSLMRQIQALAEQASAAQASAAEQEQQLLARLRMAEQTAAGATSAERDAAGRAASAEAALQAAREAAAAAVQVTGGLKSPCRLDRLANNYALHAGCLSGNIADCVTAAKLSLVLKTTAVLRQHSTGSGARRPRVVYGAGITLYVNSDTRRASQHGGHPAVKVHVCWHCKQPSDSICTYCDPDALLCHAAGVCWSAFTVGGSAAAQQDTGG